MTAQAIHAVSVAPVDLTKAQINKDMSTLSDLLYKSEWDDAAAFVKANPHTACGVNTKSKTFMKGMPFMCTAVESQSAEVVRAFAEAGAPLEARDVGGRTPLYVALFKISHMVPRPGWHQMVELLLELGCRVDTQDDNGLSILASTNCDLPLDITRRLLQGGSKVDTFDGSSNMHSIVQLISCTLSSGMKSRFENLKLIIASGAELNPEVMRINYSPIGAALARPYRWGVYSHIEVADLLLQHGANPLKRSANGDSILFSALGADSVDWILKKYPELLDAPNRRGQTPLMVQMLKARDPAGTGPHVVETVMALIAAGADLDAVDHQGPKFCKTPRMLIETCKIPELKNFLTSFSVAKEARKVIGEMSLKAPAP